MWVVSYVMGSQSISCGDWGGEGVGETECVMSRDSVGSVGVGVRE